MKRNILKILFIVWVTLWGWFFIRELFLKNNIRDYRALLFRSLEGKHAYVTGDKLYEFLTYCKRNMPAGATYKIAGKEEGDLEYRRAVYYLYPNIRSDKPDFIVDMGQSTLRKAGE